MKLNFDDRVESNSSGTPGTVIETDDHMVKIQFDHGGKPGWFNRDGDKRISKLGASNG